MIGGPYPTSDESYHALHRAGWTIGDTATVGPFGQTWIVSGHNSENLIRAEGSTRDEAWHRACDQARAVGMLYRGAGAVPIRPDTRF